MNAKAKVLEAVAGKNRGLLATESDRVKVLATIEQLEDHNPTLNPLQATELLEGELAVALHHQSGNFRIRPIPDFATRADLSMYSDSRFSTLQHRGDYWGSLP